MGEADIFYWSTPSNILDVDLAVLDNKVSSGSFKLLLDEKQRFPDSSFSASASTEGHAARHARTSSGSSWCAPVAAGKHYLQVDLGRLFHLDYLVTYGDSKSTKWVATYELNYTTNLVNWKTIPKIRAGNRNAFIQAAEQFPDVITRAVRLIPLTFVGEPCVRIDLGGETVFPDKPTNLSITHLTSRSAKISWTDPTNHGMLNLSQFWVKVRTNNSPFLDIITRKVNEYQLVNLTPSTAYEITVTAGNPRGFGEEVASTSFFSLEEAPNGTPLKIKTTSRSATSLFVTWQPPEKTRRNGVITSYTACISHSQYGACFQRFTTSERKWLSGNLNASTKYYVRALASTKVGSGNYSESQGFFTNGNPARHLNQTSKTLTFSLEIPTKSFLYFYVVALRLTDDEKTVSPDIYEDIDLVIYARTQNKTNPKPYVAALFTSGGNDNTFILGDGRITDDPTTRTANDYFNGPLEPGVTYKIFQRIIINKEGEYYSTDWSPAVKTSLYTAIGTDENVDSGKHFVAVVTSLGILLVILLVFVAYLVHQIRLKTQTINAEQGTSPAGNNLQNASNDSNRTNASAYEEVSNEQLYAGLNRSGVEEYDDRAYAHLNHVADQYVIQEESSI